jgi:O-antigen/teichoic acid export membrane protein
VGKPKLSGTLMAVAAIQYIVSLFILVPLFGLDGAAISLTLTGVTSLILIPFFIKHHLKTDVFTGLPKVMFSVTILVLILFLIPKSNLLIIFLGVIASIVVYVILLYYTGYVDKEDIQILKNIRAHS